MRDFGPNSLHDAARDRRALGAFSTDTLEQTQAICLAAEETGQPVIIQAGASAFAHSRLAELGPQALLPADLTRVPVGLHLDHSRDLAQVHALEAGYASVMVDASHLPFEDNVARTAAAVMAARTSRPRPAGKHAVVDRPLVLHGPSGLPSHRLQEARTRGVAKVNVNTELRAAFLDALRQGLPDAGPKVDLAALLGAARDAIRAAVVGVIHQLSDPVPVSLAAYPTPRRPSPLQPARPVAPPIPLHPSN